MHPFPELSDDTIRAIVERHGLASRRWSRLKSTGVVNSVYALDDELVLRVPTSHPSSVADTLTESVAAPTAHAAGVRTPRLVVFDESRTIVDVPFTIYERVRGETLGLLEEPAEIEHAWRSLGSDVAKLHACVERCPDPLGLLDAPRRFDPRSVLDELGASGTLPATHARWLCRWLDALAPTALVAVTPRFLHDDLQANNVMVSVGSHDYLAMIDWGDAGWGDPTLDFRSMPLRAIPFALEGYRSHLPLEDDETVEARVLWDQIAHAIEQLRGRGATPVPRAGYLAEILRFVLAEPGARFTRWFPR
jgi:aminoglycoside phosphotransferase (APT) family kinase protein